MNRPALRYLKRGNALIRYASARGAARFTYRRFATRRPQDQRIDRNELF
jgi:hypothetical protein